MSVRSEERLIGERRFLIEWVSDHDHDPPWENCDGHGPVSGWVRRDKHPGELVLNKIRDVSRFYNYAEAVRIALKDGWGCADSVGLTKRQIAAKAARQDFEYLLGYCTDEWSYCGIQVTMLSAKGTLLPDRSDATWGVEIGSPNDTMHHNEIINDLTRSLL